jgi:hypothetical protein
MSYASQSGRARTSARKPQAHAICDRCGFRYNHVDLRWQHEWRGAVMPNIRVLVCPECYDTPQENVRAISLPADPDPIWNARVQDFDAASTDYRSTSQIIPPDPITGIPIPSTTLRVTEDQQNRTLLPFGQPVGLTQQAVMPYNGSTQQAYGVPLSLLSVTSDGSCTVTVTCSAAHGLQTNSQISAAGLTYAPANGFYSVTVLTATAFTYQTYAPVPAQSLLAPTSRVITCLVGLPRGYTRIPELDAPPGGSTPSGFIFGKSPFGTGGF